MIPLAAARHKQHATPNDNRQYVVTAGPYPHPSEHDHTATRHFIDDTRAGDCDSTAVSVYRLRRSLTVFDMKRSYQSREAENCGPGDLCLSSGNDSLRGSHVQQL